MKIVPIILSGGSGTRLWPLSRKQFPKQYLPLAGNNTMLQETILRLDGLDNLANPVIVCNEEHRFLVAEQCQQIGFTNSTIMLEPVGKNTAPAIAAAGLQVLNNEDAVLLVLSADHVIQDIDAFHNAIEVARNHAQEGKLVTFGVVPTSANTGYGYIKSSHNETAGAYSAMAFVEKPDLITAESYLEQGNYLWNSGMFVFKASILLDELSNQYSDIVVAVKSAFDNSTKDLDFIRLEEKAFNSSPSISIDYALLEKSENVMVVPLDARWNDIGSWNALNDINNKDNDGNVIIGDVITKSTSNTYINANHHMVATIGVNDLIIVDTPDATLIASKDKAQEVKNIVESIQKSDRYESESHRKVYRPWGWYDSIEMGVTFQVKRLHIKIGAKLSYQSHSQRAEHWVVVRGVASVVKGIESFKLYKGQSTYIEVGEKHSLANNNNEELEIIEVQSGKYLGEDDIERFEDIYGRN